MMCQKCLNNFCIVRAKKSPLPLFGKRVKVSTGENSPFEKGVYGPGTRVTNVPGT